MFLNQKFIFFQLKPNKAIFSLLNKFFWKTKIALFSFIILPLLFVIIYYIASVYGNRTNVFNGMNLFIAISILPITLVNLPQFIIEMKQSFILRRVFILKIKPFNFNLLIFIYFSLICLLAILINFVFVFIFDSYNIFNNYDFSSLKYLAYINLGEYSLSILLFIFCSITFGFLLIIFIKNKVTLQFFALFFILFTFMLSGLFIPLNIISQNQFIKYINIFSLINWSLNLMSQILESYNLNYSYELFPQSYHFLNIYNSINYFGLSIFNLNHDYTNIHIESNWKPNFQNYSVQIIFSIWQKYINLLFPFIFIIIANVINTKKIYSFANDK